MLFGNYSPNHLSPEKWESPGQHPFDEEQGQPVLFESAPNPSGASPLDLLTAARLAGAHHQAALTGPQNTKDKPKVKAPSLHNFCSPGPTSSHFPQIPNEGCDVLKGLPLKGHMRPFPCQGWNLQWLQPLGGFCIGWFRHKARSLVCSTTLFQTYTGFLSFI